MTTKMTMTMMMMSMQVHTSGCDTACQRAVIRTANSVYNYTTHMITHRSLQPYTPYTHTYTHTHTRTRTHAHIHTYTHTCTHTHTHTHTHTPVRHENFPLTAPVH